MSAFSPPKCLEGRRWEGLRIGLLGGSFHPPHEGHIRLSQRAAKLLELDFVWWLVTPKNPIKDSVSTASYDERVRSAHDIASPYARIIVSRLEQRMESHYTYQTLQDMRRYFSGVSFVWLCGFDLALNFHHWRKATALPDLAPFAFFARPPAHRLVTQNMLKMRSDLLHIHLPGDFKKPWLRPGTIYWALQEPMYAISSTKLRES
jgi:nicotinate-nucleotide adenylyltransferase